MSPFLFLLLQFFGIFPFKITTKREILYSKSWHSWSVFMNLSVIFVSCGRTLLFWNMHPEQDPEFEHLQCIYSSLVRFEPVIILTRIILLIAPVFSRSLFSMYKIYVQEFVKASTSETNELTNKVTIVTLVFICSLNTAAYIIFKPLIRDWFEFLDFVTGMIQSTYSSIHFIHVYIALHVINFNLKKIEREIQGLRSRSNYYKIFIRKKILEGVDENLRMYNSFSRIFHFCVKMITFEVFYEALLGIKSIEDIVYSLKTRDFDVWLGITAVVFHLYGSPVLFLLIHQGHLFQAKVKLI